MIARHFLGARANAVERVPSPPPPPPPPKPRASTRAHAPSGREGGTQICREERGGKKSIDRSRRSVGGMFTTRVTSFALGFACASGISMYKLKEEIWSSHKILADQCANTEARLSKLEMTASKQ